MSKRLINCETKPPQEVMAFAHLNAGIRLRLSCTSSVNSVPHCGHFVVHSTSQHNTTWRSDHRAFHQSTQFHIVHSISQHSSTWRSDHRAFHQSTQFHMAVRSSCIPPVNTIPHGGQIIVHSTSQHSTTWRSDHRAFNQSTQYHMAVRTKACEDEDVG